jgi:hypothetical protein
MDSQSLEGTADCQKTSHLEPRERGQGLFGLC